MTKTLSSVLYFTLLMLLVCYEPSDGTSNYTFNPTDNFPMSIPAVCSLTLNCSVPDTSICSNMDISEKCTVSNTSSHMTFNCSDGSGISLDPDVGVIFMENVTSSPTNIMSKGTSLSCTPIVACGQDYSITWGKWFFNQTIANSSLSNVAELSVQAREYGIYRCIVTSDNMSYYLNYSLYGGPKFNKRRELFRLTLGDRVEFSCNPISVPSVTTFMWLKDGEDDMSSNNSSYVINDVQYDDEAVYTCVASNPYFSDRKIFQLKVKSPLTPLWPAIGIFSELTLMAIIILGYEWYKHHQEKKDRYKPTFDTDKKNDDGVEAYNFPSNSNFRRPRINSSTKESLLPDSAK